MTAPSYRNGYLYCAHCGGVLTPLYTSQFTYWRCTMDHDAPRFWLHSPEGLRGFSAIR